METHPSPYGCLWELGIRTAIGFFVVVLFLWRSFQSVRSRLYLRREKKLALKLSEVIEEKCGLLEKVSLVQKEYEDLESSLKNAILEKESIQVKNLEAIYANLDRFVSKFEDEILFLEEELKEEKTKDSQQDELIEYISKTIKSLEEELKSVRSHIPEATTTLTIFHLNAEGLKVPIKEVSNENSQLLESQKQLLHEAEVWEEVNGLNKQKTTLEDPKEHEEQVLREKENHIKSLSEHLLKDWAPGLEEALTDDGNLDLEMKSESEIGAHLEDQPKGALEKQLYADKLNSSFKILEGERNQVFTLVSEVVETKEDLTEEIKNLKTEQASLQSKNTQLESENQRLEQKLKLNIEIYEAIVRKLQRKVSEEENDRVVQEEKLFKMEENISYASEQLKTYRKQVKYLEEELERTTYFYQGQITHYEEKAQDNEWAAQRAERYLHDLEKQEAHGSQNFPENEFKFKKDPSALQVSNTAIGREHFPNGPSPLGRPSSEMRAPLLEKEGPLRLSPLLPGVRGRGSRGPENPLGPQIINERRESGYDGITDHQRVPCNIRPLSSPWEQNPKMMMAPPGQPYCDPRLPLPRQDGCYSNYGGPSGPAELRSSTLPPLAQMDGPMFSEMESSRNDSKVDLDNSKVPESSLPAENQETASGFAFSPFPPIRGPLFPVDPRNQFMRRGPFFPPPPPGNMYGASREYFPWGPPPPPFPMEPWCFPHYLPPRAEFPPLPPVHSESRSEFPSGLSPASNEPTTQHTEPQQEI
uniref:melanoma inhibitory activity protein 2-like n=1 Tax=Ictidomys tridecemlineatus TaxID=43179 RepID=UPI001A9F07C2|nr:melanoma inhibitory activity protein 2-like [Ictidomys tridecemlineatus]